MKFFELKSKSGLARTSIITTAHGTIKTPVFMPVGTRGTVKTQSQEELESLGAEIILGNTYHLYLRPGLDILKKFGGLHIFMEWKRPILTDSGGYQVFSLSQSKRGGQNLVKITDEGVRFSSHIDGSKHLFTPEKVIDIQLAIGSDIMMPLDVCPSAEANEKEIEQAVEMTFLWFRSAWKHYESKTKKMADKPALFAIVQGGTHPELRKRSFEELNKFPVAGFSIGGVANAGESKKKQRMALEATLPLLPEDRPRYLMGVGEPEDLLNAVELGVDMFDCVSPTRLARHGVVYTEKGKINLINSKFRTDKTPIDENCTCDTCKRYSKGYISHLLREGEVLGQRLTTNHNLHFLLTLMSDIRKAIDNDEFDQFKKDFLKKYKIK